MKQILIVVLILLAPFFKAQQNLHGRITTLLNEQHPGVKTENKLIVVNVWSEGDLQSREKNIQLNKAYNAYEYARLKGGLKGMIGVVICRDENNNVEIALGKDKISKAIVLENFSDQEIANLSNVIYNSKGEIVSQNFSGDVFEEVHKLITR